MGQFLDEEPSGKFLDEAPTQEPASIGNSIKNQLLSQFIESPTGGGLPKAAELAIKRPDMLPGMLQFSGGAVAGFPGAVGGATVGEAGRQAIEIIKGSRSSFDLKSIGAEAATTATLEGASRGLSKLFFGRFQAGRRLAEREGLELKNIKSKLSTIQTNFSPDDVLKPLKDGFRKIEVKTGEAASAINKWIVKLEGMKKNGVQKLSGTQLMQFEDMMGAVSRFGKETTMGEPIRQAIKQPLLNSLGKEMNRMASNMVDNFAIEQGYKSFPKLSKTVSSLIKTTSSKPFRLGFGESAALAGFTGLKTANPMLGVGTFAAARLADNQLFRELAFKASDRLGLGRAATLAGTELLRQFVKPSEQQ